MPAWGRFPVRRIEHVDIVRLPLTPIEAFVLSQLDAASDLSELAFLTSLSDDVIERAISRLVEVGAIEYKIPIKETRVEKPARPRTRDPRRDDDDEAPREEQVRPSHVSVRPRRESVPEPIAPAPPTISPPPEPKISVKPDAVADADDIEIDEERRRRIDEVFDKLDGLSHYQLLRIDRKASKKDVKEAYYSLIGIFHPDRYFGKRVGDYKRRLERVFERMTQAYNVLSRDKTRAEYDEYLGDRQRTASYDAVLSSIPPPPPPSEPKMKAVAREAPPPPVIV